MRVAYVTHRYGVEIRGGAEQAVRSLAEHVAAGRPWTVEVFTTGARDGVDWHDQYPAGTTEVGGVTVHRYHSRSGRAPEFGAQSDRVLPSPENAPLTEQHRWIDMQGPVAPAVLDAATAFDPDVVVFCPYLYWPTVRGVPRFPDRAVLHPAAHDEAPFRLPVIEPVFTAARGLAYFSDAERRLVEGRFRVGATAASVIGLGVDTGEGSTDAFRAAARLDDRPYLLCLGRVDAGKGSLALARFFTAYKERHPGDLALAFVGPVGDQLPPSDDIVVTGPVEEDAKWGAINGAEVLVSPSPRESFSIVLMEGWTKGVPAMVNAWCEVTVDHCRTSGGGLWFADYAGFEVALARIQGGGSLRDRLGQAGRAYVEERYSWPAVTERYVHFLESVASGRA